MIKRDLYLHQLLPYIDKPLIKVITGLRRSGKSVLLMLLRDELLARGVASEQILYINFESFRYNEVSSASDFYNLIASLITNKSKYYLLIDEIQEVTAWEKVINSCTVDFAVDIYITGSNSKLLSSELATFLAGRYVEIHVYPLSFAEYLYFKQCKSGIQPTMRYDEFDLFLKIGGFPVLHIFDYEIDTAYKIVYDIYSSAILRDTVQRNNIRDTELLERVVKYVFDNIGSKFSAKNVADFFKSQHRKVDINTIYNFLQALEAAFIVYRVSRFDVKGKEILKTQEKFFIGDQSLLYAVMGFRERQISGILENIVLLELKRRGYKVYVGKVDEREIDFVAEQANKRLYVQVAYKLYEQSTIDREFGSLLAVRDQYPKFVVSMDETWSDTVDGVKQMHIADFLLADY